MAYSNYTWMIMMYVSDISGINDVLDGLLRRRCSGY
jgi:hypothetical protein